MRKTGRFGPYVAAGRGRGRPARFDPQGPARFDLEWALKLLALPRTIGQHPESGKDITASIGRYGPYLAHDGKYAKLSGTREVFETGMNAAVTLLAEAANRKSGGGRASAEPVKILGAHPTSGGEMKVMPGRYGPYVTDGTTNATIPRDMKPEDVTEEQAIALIDARAAKGPAKKRAAARRPRRRKRRSSMAKEFFERHSSRGRPRKRASCARSPPRARASGNRQGDWPERRSTKDFAKKNGIAIAKKR